MAKEKSGKRYSEEQILSILHEVETGVRENTVYRWKSKFGDMNQGQLRQLSSWKSRMPASSGSWLSRRWTMSL